MPSTKCPNCGLVNFAVEEFCKRCRNNLTNLAFSSEGNSLNININFPQNATQALPNVEINQFQDDQPLENQYQLPLFSGIFALLLKFIL